MLPNLELFNLKNKVIAVAVSGGSDSMALLYYMYNNAKKFSFTLKAINVEHGIRNKASIDDSIFVKEECEKLGIPLLSYSVDAITYSKESKLTLEEGARILRYDCFYKAIAKGFCEIIATAHHVSDNAETVLLNLFRGSGIKGLRGINAVTGKIIRPFIKTTKQEIADYVKQNNINFVTDDTNFQTEHYRNYIRLEVMPTIKKRFPEVEESISRLSDIARLEDDFLDGQATKAINKLDNGVEIQLSLHPAILNRAIIIGLKMAGIKKDWEMVNVTDVANLTEKETGKFITLKNGVKAIREYDKIVLYSSKVDADLSVPFLIGDFTFNGKTYAITKVGYPTDVKNGIYIDRDAIPPTAVIRSRQAGDFIKAFGGGTKLISDLFTDKKIPQKDRDNIPIIADGNEVYAIFGVTISEKAKITVQTANILKLT